MSEYTQFVHKKYLERTRKVPELDEDEAAHNIEELVLWILHSSAARMKEQCRIEKDLDASAPEGGHPRQYTSTKFRVLAQSALVEYRAALDRQFRVSLDDVAWVLAGQYLEGHRRGK
jgi:hypothetical protein